MNNRLTSLLQFVEENGRVCPRPQKWNKLWEILPDRKRRSDGGWKPHAPLILAAWDSPNLYKIMRLREHIEWADSNGVLDEVDTFLRGLSEENWHHMTD